MNMIFGNLDAVIGNGLDGLDYILGAGANSPSKKDITPNNLKEGDLYVVSRMDIPQNVVNLLLKGVTVTLPKGSPLQNNLNQFPGKKASFRLIGEDGGEITLYPPSISD